MSTRGIYLLEGCTEENRQEVQNAVLLIPGVSIASTRRNASSAAYLLTATFVPGLPDAAMHEAIRNTLARLKVASIPQDPSTEHQF